DYHCGTWDSRLSGPLF
nr:immunoglobulin light chain junction region [Macaca mulatta]MOY09799.1 immunoglobulin light chain junction region [Macaca mulatta]